MARAFKFPDFTHELRRSAWLAGFIDGEGSLQIHKAPRGNCWPGLQLTQRDDDSRLLVEIAAALGGSLQFITPRPSDTARNPCLHVKVNGKASLLGAVAYLDEYPLRTKKAMEYVVWRGAVIAYVNDGGWSPVLLDAKAQIESFRVYKESDMPVMQR